MQKLVMLVCSIFSLFALHAQSGMTAEEVLNKLTMSFYNGPNRGYILNYSYIDGPHKSVPVETDEGVLLKSGTTYYLRQFGQEKLSSNGVTVFVDHDFELVKAQDTGLSATNFGLISQQLMRNIKELIRSESVTEMSNDRSKLTLQTVKGDVEKLEIVFATETYEIYNVSLTFRIGNTYGFPPGSKMEIEYEVMAPDRYIKETEQATLDKFIIRKEDGSYSLSDDFRHYQLITL